ncbi:MAG: polysaccharide biosynthesis protein PslH [Solirubrobacteraceae bacterium]|nr:polysaccharide biosynthesis protein PslH [Solirubrobacteraceae bacterium]
MRILVLLPFALRADVAHGGGRANLQLVTGLARAHEVGVLSLRSFEDAPTDRAVAESLAFAEEEVRPPVHDDWRYLSAIRLRNGLSMLRGRPRLVAQARLPRFERRVRLAIEHWHPDVVQIEFEQMAQYVLALPDGPPRVLSVHDPGTAAARERLQATSGPRRALRALDVLAWLSYERRALAAVDAVVAFTERDRRALGSRRRIELVPLAAERPTGALDPAGAREDVLFVGSFPHLPNRDAALRLVDGILPAVRRSRPAATLTLVGERPPPGLARTGVRVTGAVPDVAPYLDAAAVVAVPIRLGGGMRVKVLEALAGGKAVVTSRLAAEGLDLEDGAEVLFAETDDEFARAIERLLGDRALRVALAGRAGAWAARRVDPAARIAAYERIYARLLGDRPVTTN